MKLTVFPTRKYITGANLPHKLAAAIRIHALLLLLSTLILGGCGGGEETQALPNTGSTATNSNYDGPPPATDDVQNFKVSVWDNLVSTSRCGACHSTGGQSPTFVHDGDINIAYAQANTIVSLNDPSQSLMVTKVAGGHNCWLSSDAACADTLTSYIGNWAGGSAGSAKTVELRAPNLKDPGQTKTFPAFSDSDFENSDIYSRTRAFCIDCHIEGIQQPYIASSNPEVAYDAVQSRINLQDPVTSRLVVRLYPELHNCWQTSPGEGADCLGSAVSMTNAIEAFAGTLSEQPLDSDMVASKALNLTGDGLVANSGGRFEDNVIALYEFKTGQGRTAFDTSGIEPALHLNLIGNVGWVGGWGINVGAAYTDEDTGATIRNGKAQGSTTTSKKLHDLLTASGEYSIEAWVVPGNTTQEDARIITYSGSADSRNVTLSQTLQNYEVLHRSTTTDQNSAFSTADGDERLQATLQHVVVNFTASEGRKIYINGEYTGDLDPSNAGLLNEWDDSFALVMGNETDGNSLWEGTLRMVAIHNRALTNDQILTNFEVGVGQKYFLLFSVAHLIDVPESYIVFEVSQFDSYSYLFTNPFFISLDGSAIPQGIAVEGLRIGINGKAPTVGQAFANIDLTLNDANYEPGSGQTLSRLGALIELELGPDTDEFFLSFEKLGDNTNVFVEATPPAPPTPADGSPVSDIGLKTFDEINASMAKVTGVPTTNAAVALTFNTVRQQLPSVENIQGFLSSQQMAVTQMAIQYCDALVRDNSLRASYFPGFDFTADASDAFDATGRSQIINPLLDRVVGQNIEGSQPTDTDVRAELDSLITNLVPCSGGDCADRTETVVKASCAAVLGSAVTLLQ